MQPIGVPSDDDVDQAGLQVGEQLLVARPPLAAVGADVVFDVGLSGLPPSGLDQAAAVALLARDPEAGALAVVGDAQV